jgi:type II secretory pathway predicted ATPase ExeA
MNEALTPSTLAWFGLARDPFEGDPATAELTGPQRRAAAFVAGCVARDSGASLVLGSAGTGKSVLVGALSAGRLAAAGAEVLAVTVRCSVIRNQERSLLAALGGALGVPRRTPAHRLYREIESAARAERDAGRSVVLLVDEAEKLGHRSLFALVALWNMSSDAFVVQFALFGRPEFHAVLREPRNRALESRVGVDVVGLGTMTPEEGAAFVADSLAKVGGTRDLLSGDALTAVVRDAPGLPGPLAAGARRALATAAARGERRVTLDSVRSGPGVAPVGVVRAS